jgi:hypothetical protein
MRKTEFDKLKVGQRVVVSGDQDGSSFDAEAGEIIERESDHVLVRFDMWFKGHGMDDNEWHFYDYDAKGFTIKVEKPATKKRPHGSQEYKGNGKHTWEQVTKDTERLRVAGGWLYKYHVTFPTYCAPMITFVPMPEVVGYAV